MDDPKIPDALPEDLSEVRPEDLSEARPGDRPDPQGDAPSGDLPGAPGSDGSDGSGGSGGEAGQSPYKNLLVPLVVVPAMIVMVLVLVWVLFGSLAGSEKGPEENLQRMTEGAANERDQAAQLLVNQISAYLQAKSAGREPEWELDASFLPAIQRAWEDTDEDDLERLYVLAFFQRQLGDTEGLNHLIELAGRSDEGETAALVRFLSIHAIGVLAPVYDEREDKLAVQTLATALGGTDSGMKILAASGLGALGGPDAVQALAGALGEGALDVRGSAAMALASLGDPSGASVLVEMLDPEVYAAEREANPNRWYRGEQISQSRIQAVKALARLGRPEDLAVLEALESEEEDKNVLAEILAALRDAEAG